MATTDSRTGFRLPWSTDRVASREASADPADEHAAAATTLDPHAAGVDRPADGPATPASAPGPGDTSDQDAAGDGVRGQEEALVTTLAPDAAPQAALPPAAAPWAASGAPVGAAAAPTYAASNPAAPARRPTKFLADLTRAMQAAAEQARTTTLEQYRAESTTAIEQIHASSATGATELRRHADDDVSAIKEWSKAEIARVREETERRVTDRREQLEGQLERHAAIIEHEIEKIRGRVSAFESEMGSFFDELLHEDDPAVFAARAANLPEPPSFEGLDGDAIAALLQEPGLGVPEPTVEPAVDSVVDPVADSPAIVEAVIEPPTEAVAENATAEPAVVAEAAAEGEGEALPDAESMAEAEGTAPLDRDAAMEAIQAAAEAGAVADAVGTTDPAEVGDDGAVAYAPEPAPEVEILPSEAVATETPELGEVAGTGAEAEIHIEPETETETASHVEVEIDPRLVMLGLTPDFAAAEMAAEEEAAADVEEVPEIGGDVLEARLSGLVPGEAPAPAAPSITTQVVVTGLVSVASIASFKRHVGRLAGVAHVGVSSGPDGEFLFAVEHDPETSLRDLIPTLPGFGARVVSAGEGIVHVSAQDPQD